VAAVQAHAVEEVVPQAQAGSRSFLVKVGQSSFVVLADAERTRRLVVPGGRAAAERI